MVVHPTCNRKVKSPNLFGSSLLLWSNFKNERRFIPLYMNEELERNINYDLEKMIRKSTKIAKDKYMCLQSREKRKLGIKEKKLPQKSVVKEEEF